MRRELDKDGHDVMFVGVNSASAAGSEDQTNLTDRCRFALLQNLDEVGAWALMGGGKDDFYIYDVDGKLAHYFDAHGEVSTNLSTDEGYDALKDAILDVLGE